MTRRWTELREGDRAVFQAVTAFLNGRLEERATVNWALRLKPNATIMRSALLDVIDSQIGRKTSEPWSSAWSLVAESWKYLATNDSSADEYDILRRIRGGDRSGFLLKEVIEFVAPRLDVEPLSDWHSSFRRIPKRPRKVSDLLSLGLTSTRSPERLFSVIGDLRDRDFLISLAHALEATVVSGLDIAQRVGLNANRGFWQLGELRRVYFVPVSDQGEGEHEPDKFHRGIAPSTKLLYTVVCRLADIDIASAIEFARRWKLAGSPVHLRLWAALARDHCITAAKEVAALLMSLDDQYFWDLHEYPEIAELRASRFNQFDSDDQAALGRRIRKCPPRSRWPGKMEPQRLNDARLFSAVRELKRIEIAGSSLSVGDKEWLSANISRYPDLDTMSRIDDGFLPSAKAYFVPPDPDSKYDMFQGEQRLTELENALSLARDGWDDGLAGRATDWIKQATNPLKILADFEATTDGGASFGRVWERIGWYYSPIDEQGKELSERNLKAEAARVLSLLGKLPEPTIRQAIEGISNWLSNWRVHISALPEGLKVWLKVWPIAIDATNANQSSKADTINSSMQSSDDSEPMDLETLNTPAGRLVSVFLAACPTVKIGGEAFREGETERQMRDAIESALGASGSIVKRRLIEYMPYFLTADRSWTLANLVTPLYSDISLWPAVARQRLSSDVMLVIGNAMADRSVDSRLSRHTRRSLVFRVVIDCLHAFKDGRQPSVPEVRILQMLRSVDDEVRLTGAEAIEKFVREVSTPQEDLPTPPSPEELFRTAAKPFLEKVWPQERSLVTPGVSKAMANLPAATCGEFVEAVDAIERFLVPFDCWSVLDYGLHDDEPHELKLSNIDSPRKADAFLRLLNLTIGTTETSVIPNDLSDALNQVRMAAPGLAENQMFRRLATAARRF